MGQVGSIESVQGAPRADRNKATAHAFSSREARDLVYMQNEAVYTAQLQAVVKCDIIRVAHLI